MSQQERMRKRAGGPAASNIDGSHPALLAKSSLGWGLGEEDCVGYNNVPCV